MFLPCHKDDTAMDTAIMIWNKVISHTGLFQNIISDTDPKFTSALWTNLHNLFGTKLSFSTAYHPQTDGLAEIMIQTLEDMIRRFCAYGLEFKDSDGFTHDWCTLVFMQLNIITQDAERKASLPIRNLKIKLRGIGGHMKSLVGQAEFTQVLFPSGEGKEIHFFSSKGELYTVLGRPFLEDNNLRLDLSEKQVEIFSYQEVDGRRACMPIFKPHILGWKTGPQRGMELCSMRKIKYWFRKVEL
ncbi:hypothetical protein O181_125291 [Austropuccinia psidii MF-1]|uniref:Integrase catalytic domain-containing protein n=1 Tax=Austropuccinia psidii MF-1 TaxID=1389203 RepID=A0A9Q3Q4W8_9BASI|nr:hypothetical protein [Austropuccinia psidii MF-1]